MLERGFIEGSFIIRSIGDRSIILGVAINEKRRFKNLLLCLCYSEAY